MAEKTDLTKVKYPIPNVNESPDLKHAEQDVLEAALRWAELDAEVQNNSPSKSTLRLFSRAKDNLRAACWRYKKLRK